MDLQKQKNVRFQHESIKRRHNNFEEYTDPLIGEFETSYLEIISRKRKINDSIPGEYYIAYYLTLSHSISSRYE